MEASKKALDEKLEKERKLNADADADADTHQTTTLSPVAK